MWIHQRASLTSSQLLMSSQIIIRWQKGGSLSLFFGWQNTHTHPQLAVVVVVVGMKEDLG
jgi:hypothetical protein